MKLVASKFLFNFATYQLSTVVMMSQKNFDMINLLKGNTSNILQILRTLGLVLDTFSASKILPKFDLLSAVNSCQVVTKKNLTCKKY